MVIGVVVAVVFVGLLAGAAGLVNSAVRRRGSNARMDPRSVRRFFQYLILFALVILVCLGASELVGRLLGAVPDEWDNGAYQLAQAWAFVLVGAPAAGLLTWWTLRSHSRDPAERRSAWAAVYLTLMALTTAVVAAVGLQGVIQAAIADVRLDPGATAALLVWGGAWVAHWWWTRLVLDDASDSFHIMGGSLAGLVMMAVGAVLLLGTSLEVFLQPSLIGDPRAAFGEAAGTFAAGAALWVFYWLARGIRRRRDTIWLAVVLLVGVGGALVLALVSATLLIWSVLVWLVGDPGTASAAQHFSSAPTQLAGVLIGAALWWYHRSVLGELPGRPEVRRVYEYLVAGAALVATFAGVGTVIVSLIEGLTPGIDVGMATLNTLLAAVTLLLVGAPVWWLYWGQAQRALRLAPLEESTSPTRRIYLAVVLAASAIAAIVSLITVVFTVVQDGINGQFGGATVRSVRYGLGVLVATALVALYHGLLVRAERSPQPASAAGSDAGHRSVVLVGPEDPDLTRALVEAGWQVEVWRSRGSGDAHWDTESLLATLASHAGCDLLVVAGAAEPTVVDVDRGERAHRRH